MEDTAILSSSCNNTRDCAGCSASPTTCFQGVAGCSSLCWGKRPSDLVSSQPDVTEGSQGEPKTSNGVKRKTTFLENKKEADQGLLVQNFYDIISINWWDSTLERLKQLLAS